MDALRGENSEEFIGILPFKYVTNKPYTVSIKDRTPQEVIKVGGDCDEKFFLFASILVERKHKCVIVYTNLKVRANLYSHTASLEIDGKYYFYAETTAKNTHIGWFNGIKKESILGVYDVNEKKEIGLDRIALNIN